MLGIYIYGVVFFIVFNGVIGGKMFYVGYYWVVICWIFVLYCFYYGFVYDGG